MISVLSGNFLRNSKITCNEENFMGQTLQRQQEWLKSDIPTHQKYQNDEQLRLVLSLKGYAPLA